MRCEAKVGENTAFLVELSYAGLFTITGLADEHIKPVLLIEAPACCSHSPAPSLPMRPATAAIRR